MLFKELGLNSQSDATGSDLFGASTASNAVGDLFVVGAPGHQSNKGAVYLFRRNHDGTRTQIQKITPSDSPSGARFGSSVSISDNGSVLVVGAPNNTGFSSRTNHGAVYIYFWNGSSFSGEQKILPSGGSSPSSGSLNNTYFGHSVRLSYNGNFLVVGNNADAEAGCLVYTYQKSGSSFSSFSVLSNPRSGAYVSKFGRSVCLDETGMTLVVGAPMLAASDVSAPFSVKPGGAFTYIRVASSYSLLDSIYFTSTGFPFTEFGASVATNHRATIFAFGVPQYNSSQGAVAIFKATTPTVSMGLGGPVNFESKGYLIQPTTGTGSNLRFGSSISLDRLGNRMLVGMDGFADTVGKIWLFEVLPDLLYKSYSSGKTAEQVFEVNPPSTNQSGQRFGQSVALSRDGLIAFSGSPNHNTNGSVFSYKSRVYARHFFQEETNNFASIEGFTDVGIDVTTPTSSLDIIPPVSKVAQVLVPTITFPNRIDIVLGVTGSPSGSITLSLVFGDSVGPYSDPNAVLASSSLSVGSISGQGIYSFGIANRLIQENDFVWLTLSFDSTYLSSADSSNFVSVFGVSGSYPELRTYDGSWSTISNLGICYQPYSNFFALRSEVGRLSTPPFDISNSLVTQKGAPFSVNGGEKIMFDKNGFVKQTLYLPTPAVAGQLSQQELVDFLNNNLDARFNCTAEARTIDGKNVVALINNDPGVSYHDQNEVQSFIRMDSAWDAITNGTNPSDNALSFTNGATVWYFRPDVMGAIGLNKTSVVSDWHDWFDGICKPLQTFYFSNQDFLIKPLGYFRYKIFGYPVGSTGYNWTLRELYTFVINNFVLNPTTKKVLDMNGNYAPASLSGVIDECPINMVLVHSYDPGNDQQYLGALWYR